MNQGAQFVRHLQNMIVLARVIAQGARNRDESRGAHFKPEFPQRDDAELAAHDAGVPPGRRQRHAGRRRYVRDFDYSLVRPARPRDRRRRHVSLVRRARASTRPPARRAPRRTGKELTQITL
jgi:hypothetical protein